MLRSHFLNSCLHLANRRGKRLERVIQASRVHYVQSNIYRSIGQSPLPESLSEQPQTLRNHAQKSRDQASQRADRARSCRQAAETSRFEPKTDSPEARASTETHALFTWAFWGKTGLEGTPSCVAVLEVAVPRAIPFWILGIRLQARRIDLVRVGAVYDRACRMRI
jgi:hypothetical protein